MSRKCRILLTWELGLNFGHLARLLPLGLRLQARGHQVLAAVRDMSTATTMLGAAGIPFVQAPFQAQEIRLPHRPASYADILLSQGWADGAALRVLVEGWLNLFQRFQPDLLVLDYSPTVRLAARIANIPTALVGNGFELPPVTSPLPPFPGFSWASQESALTSENMALENANDVIRSFDMLRLETLRELFSAEAVFHATFAELDHYGPRSDARYSGPLLGGLKGEPIGWPPGPGPCIFACLRPDTPGVNAILEGLSLSGANVVCFAPGFSGETLHAFHHPHMRFTSRPVDLISLVSTADICVSYGAEGTVAQFLLAGVPQLIVPRYVEAQMMARRIELLGAGLVLRGEQTPQGVAMMLDRMIRDSHYKQHAASFAERHRSFDTEQAADTVVNELEIVLGGTMTNVFFEQPRTVVSLQ